MINRFFKSCAEELVRAIAIPLFLFGLFAVAFAFTEPSVGPAGGTVYAPVNTGGTAQTKLGNFTSSGTLTGNTINAAPNLCISGSCITAWSQAGGVSQIIAGTNVTISPLSGTGAVTINASGGGGLSGGSINYVPKWTSATALSGTSNIYDNGTNVGIGTVSPSEKLHVNGSVYVGGNFYKAGNITSVSSAISLWSAEGGVLSGFNSGKVVAMGQTTSGYPGFGVSSGATTLAAFYHDPFSNETVVEAYGARNIRFATNGASRMYVSSNGYVGIGSGMSSPWSQLDIGGGVGLNGPAFRAMDNSFSKYIFIVPYLGTGGYSSLSQSGDSGIFSAQGTGLVIAPWNVSGIRISSTGDVNVGAGVFMNSGGYAHFNSTLDAQDYWIRANGRWASSLSDVRLKKDIQPLTNVLDKLSGVHGVSFNWNESYTALGHQNNARQIGVIAQELETSFPELVTTAPNADGYKSVNYEGLTAVLLEAVKEQQKEIDLLKARIEALEKR